MNHVWTCVLEFVIDTDDLFSVLLRFLHSEDGRIAETKVYRLYPNAK